MTFHHEPKPLHADAITHDWTSFLGPTSNAVSSETKLLKEFPESGPPLVWEMENGTSYASSTSIALAPKNGLKACMPKPAGS